ncbi:hypothetical protein AMAG_03988 [Allomyces macrogynus ATCC 38327]|uniref:Uncharacterized protein n=1 Tax=Allomyces macrogynus (strain ATCC 38327) TaxID=578462 RepID=A0A0L0S7L5_ALLM3|nr:hypothetical protein AMAG_03988 [Allomyces macrogynus ATCC 38327]|eukprot:KNE58415.1 hypothetical protein AMAG_03988 [Allomyces macrogynus ATCC 38327]
MSQHDRGSNTSDDGHDDLQGPSRVPPKAASGHLHQFFALQLARNNDNDVNSAREDLTQFDTGGDNGDDYDGSDAVTPRVGLLSQLHRTSSSVDRAKDAEEGFLKRFVALQQQSDNSSLFNKNAVSSNDSLDAAWLGRARVRRKSASTVHHSSGSMVMAWLASYAAVQAISSAAQAFRRARIAVTGGDQLSARGMRRAHALTPVGIARLVRALSFALHPPAAILALGAFATLVTLRLQVWYIDTYLTTSTVPFQEQLLFTSEKIVLSAAEDLDSSIRLLLDEEYSLIDLLTDHASTMFNQRVMSPIKSVLSTINGTLSQIDGTLTDMVDTVLTSAPALQLTMHQLAALELLIVIKLPRAQVLTMAVEGDPAVSSATMFKNVTLAWLNTMDPKVSADRGLRAGLLKIRTQLVCEEEFAQWGLLFACAPTAMGLVYFCAHLVWTDCTRGPWKKRKQRCSGSTWPQRDEVLHAPLAVAAFLANPSKWWPALCAVTPRPRIRLAAKPRLAIARSAAACRDARKRIFDVVVLRRRVWG